MERYFIQLDHRMDMEYKSQLHLSVGLRLDEGPVYGSGEYTLTKVGLFTETKTAAAGLAKK